MHFPVHEGEPEFGSDGSRKEGVMILGSGNLGTVYRITPKSGDPYIRKQYTNPADLLFEMGGLRALTQAAKTLKTFKVAKVTHQRLLSVYFKDVRGQSLYTLLNQGILVESSNGKSEWYSPLSNEKKLELKKRFEDLKAQLIDHFLKKYRGASAHNNWRPGSNGDQPHIEIPYLGIPGSSFFRSLIIKADSIIVDPVTLEFTIVDPQ